MQKGIFSGLRRLHLARGWTATVRKSCRRVVVAAAVMVGLLGTAIPASPAPPVANAATPGLPPSVLRQLKFSDGTQFVTHLKVDHANVNTIPHWDGSYDYFKSTFGFSMVGSKPGTGQSTTVVPAALIPFRLVFADGTVLDASTDLSGISTPVRGIINSPIFAPSTFSISLGTTQFGDAYQRANFWNIVSTKAQDYHVLLGSPTVLAAQTITVPRTLGMAFVDPATHAPIGLIDLKFLDQQAQAAMASLAIDPATLPIFVYHNTLLTGRGFVAQGYHNALPLVSATNGQRATQTYISTTYFDPAEAAFAETSDIDVLSHEVAEWLDDPFLDNNTPCHGLIEVADPAVQFEFTIPLNGTTYHLQDIMFLSWFTLSSPSLAINGWYSFRNNFSTPERACPPVVLQLTPTASIGFPGAEDSTFASGINGGGDVVGTYQSLNGAVFGDGFLLSKGVYTTIDPSGATGGTFPSKINDHGLVVGTYLDASFNAHGFTYLDGTFTTIDYPGTDGSTNVTGVNNLGDMVGTYADTNRQFHGFLLHNGTFETIDVPGAKRTVLEGINAHGDMVGWYDFGVRRTSFAILITRDRQFSTITTHDTSFNRVYSINNDGQIVGENRTASFAVGRHITVQFVASTPNGPLAGARGNNASGQVVGQNYEVALPNNL